MNPKIALNHHSPFKLSGVRDLLERLAALETVERVIPGRMRHVGGGGRLRLTDSGMVAGQSGRKYIILSDGVSLELFLVPGAGRRDEMERAISTLPEYAAQGMVRRQAEAERAAAREARLAAARQHHGPRRRPAPPAGGQLG